MASLMARRASRTFFQAIYSKIDNNVTGTCNFFGAGAVAAGAAVSTSVSVGGKGGLGGDAGLVATKMQWSQWGSARARGAGVGEEKICTPNCAEGRVAKGKMRLSLSRPRLCAQDGKRHFTKVRYSWPNGAPGEGPNQGTIPLPCSILS